MHCGIMHKLRNILIYFQNVCLFLFSGPSRWEDKVTATKIRGSPTPTKSNQWKYAPDEIEII